MSDRQRSKNRRIHKRYRSKSPVFSDSLEADESSLPDFREICDLCMEPQKPGGPKLCGRAVTFVNADKLVHLRYLVELALKLYNDNKLNSFKLVKVCKINRFRPGYYGLTFRAHENGSEDCPVFRGVVRALRGKEVAMFCEIKEQVMKFRVDSKYEAANKEFICMAERMMMKSHFYPVTMITAVQDEHVKVKIDPLHKYKMILEMAPQRILEMAQLLVRKLREGSLK